MRDGTCKSLEAQRTDAHSDLSVLTILSCLLCLLVAVGSLVIAPPASAEPSTLYRPEDIARARENVRRYRWAQRIVDGWRRRVAYVMARDRRFIEEMISDLTPWSLYGQNCPVCVGKLSSMGECNLYRWKVTEPDKLVCKYCGTVYPNRKYPETGKLVCPRMGQTFTYYETEAERAHPEDKSGRYAFRWASWPVHTSWTGIIRTNKAEYVIDKALPLAKLYALTGEVRYAERAAWILDRFAHVYPNYLFHTYNGTYADCPPAEAARELGRHPRAGRFPKDVIINAFGLHQYKDHARLNVGFWGAGRYRCSGGDGAAILEMLVAYDLIREARHEDGRPVLSPEMDRRIRNDLLLAGLEDCENWQEINNKCGPGRALSAAAGILFERPQSVRHALSGFQQLLERCFHSDGFCMESPSYSSMHLSLMRDIPEILRGYSDPAGYQPPDGERLERLDPFSRLDRYRLALESMVRMLAPGRRYPVIGDTHAGSGISSIWAEILADRYDDRYAGLLEAVQGKGLAEAGSEYALWYRDPDMRARSRADLPLRTEWFPGWHVAVLRAGKPQGDTAFYLNGYSMHGHRHYDTLGIIYYAFGKELASDRGYIWDDPRNAWTKSTLAHNIVAVDGRNQIGASRHSRLELFAAASGVEVVQASANAYAQCDRYQRTCVLVQAPGNQTYAVDIFRLRGGKLHQYCLNANGKLIACTTPDLQLIDEQIPWLDNLRAAVPKEPFTATWQYEGVRLDLTMLSRIDRLIVADAPGWRSDRGSELHAPPIQQILAERSAGGGRATSQYVALLVPYAGQQSPVRSTRLLVNDLETGTVAVEVELADRVDTIVCALDAAPRQVGSMIVAGKFAFVSCDRRGNVQRAYLLAGTKLRVDGVSLARDAAVTRLGVASVEGRTIKLEEPLPADPLRPGQYILAGGTGYEIERAHQRTITVRDYPVTPCDEITILNETSWEAAKD